MEQLKKWAGFGGSKQQQDEDLPDGDGYGPLMFQKNEDLDPAAGTDIVFVHGLRGSRVSTWTKDGVCWPRDMLGEDVDDIRVIMWGYDSSIANATRFSSLQSVFGHAESLARDLKMVRKGVTRRLLFVCHSLGGIVVKDALIYAALNVDSTSKPYLGAMLKATVGVVFFGTPHRGSSLQSLGHIIAGAASVGLRSPNTQLLDVLRTDSQYLEPQRKNFVTISSNLSIVCIREEVPTYGSMVVPETSASYDGVNVETFAIPANHLDIVKFKNREEIGYMRAKSCIDELCCLTPEQRSSINTTRVNDIMTLLEFSRMDSREQEISTAYSDTFSWIFSDTPATAEEQFSKPPGFMSWLESGDPAFWITGKPGSGKSTLMKHIYNDERTERALVTWAAGKPLIRARHYIHDRGSSLEKSLEGLMRSLLYQVLDERRFLVPQTFPELYNQKRSPRPYSLTEHVLQTAFQNCRKNLQPYRISVFVDALDEIRLDPKSAEVIEGQREVTGFLKTLLSWGNVKICYAARDLRVFHTHLLEAPTLQVHEYTSRDILLYCLGRLKKEGFPPEVANSLSHSVADRSEGVFVWVEVVLRKLANSRDTGSPQKEMNNILDSLPNELAGEDGLFMRTMRDIDPRHYRQTMAISSIMAHWYTHLADIAKCPLDVIHLLLSVEIYTQDNSTGVAEECARTKPQPWPSLEHIWTRCRRIIDSRCSVLVEGTKSVQFVHKTAQDFLTDRSIWQQLLNEEKPALDESCTLALLEAAVLRAKCCQEVVADGTELGGHNDPRFPDQCPLLGSVVNFLEKHPPVHDISRSEQIMDSLDSAGAHLVNTLAPALRGRSWMAFYFTFKGFYPGYRHPYSYKTVYDVAFMKEMVWYLKLKKRDKRFDKDALHYPLTLHPEMAYPNLIMAKDLGLSVNYRFTHLYSSGETPWTLLLSNLDIFFEGDQVLWHNAVVFFLRAGADKRARVTIGDKYMEEADYFMPSPNFTLDLGDIILKLANWGVNGWGSNGALDVNVMHSLYDEMGVRY